jgi:hypothetical protein
MVGESSDLFRAVNERIHELSNGVAEYDCVCECGDEHCVQVLRLTADEYQALRSDPMVFAVVPGHDDDVGAALARTDRYVFVRSALPNALNATDVS